MKSREQYLGENILHNPFKSTMQEPKKQKKEFSIYTQEEKILKSIGIKKIQSVNIQMLFVFMKQKMIKQWYLKRDQIIMNENAPLIL